MTSSSIGIALVVTLGLVVATVLRARTIATLKPVLDVAARKHTAVLHQSLLGMPQITKHVGGRAIRMTPMSVSTSSPEGGGEMTCVDFDWPRLEVGEFRMREKSAARRNAVPTALTGGNQPFTLGIPQLDARFAVVGTNRAEAARILTDTAVVESIIALPRGADIHIRGGKCYVTVSGFPHHIDVIDGLFTTSERLLASVGGYPAR